MAKSPRETRGGGLLAAAGIRLSAPLGDPTGVSTLLPRTRGRPLCPSFSMPPPISPPKKGGRIVSVRRTTSPPNTIASATGMAPPSTTYTL